MKLNNASLLKIKIIKKRFSNLNCSNQNILVF